jgi:hypothetical protein
MGENAKKAQPNPNAADVMIPLSSWKYISDPFDSLERV